MLFFFVLSVNQWSFSPSSDFGRQNLHRLFRLLDADNDGMLSHPEFQSGLVAMGFRVAQDSLAVSRLINAVDADNTGAIDEDAFLRYFQRLKKEDLEENLQQWQDTSVEDIEVVSFDVTVSK